jgi:hypothetical protein
MTDNPMLTDPREDNGARRHRRETTTMITARLAVLLTLLGANLRQRVDRLRREPDHGGHAVEYAIGIGGSAFVILSIIVALKTGLAGVIKNWVFK